MSDQDDDNNDSKTSKRQSKRASSYKAKAFEKFKQIRSGTKHKYEVEEVDNVYDTYDEKEYTKKVLERQDDDWIVDDNGSGYIEDGRDIFDDDLDRESIEAASSSKGNSVKKKKTSLSKAAVKGNLKYLLSNMPNKKQTEEQKIEDDSALNEILGEIDENPTANIVKPKPVLNSFCKFAIKQVEKDYMAGLRSPNLRPNLKLTPKSIASTSRINKTIQIDKESSFRKNQSGIDEREAIAKMDIFETQQFDENTESLVPNEVTQDFTEDINKEQPKTIAQPMETQETSVDDCFNDDLDFSQMDDIIESAINEKMESVWNNIEEEMLNDWVPTQEENNIDDLNQVVEDDICQNEDQDVFRFYWLDAFEDQFKQPGVVFLFGKTYNKTSKSYVSSCVSVRNVERKIYFLPRPKEKDSDNPITPQDVYQEVNKSVMKSLQVKQFKARPIVKKYAFDPEVPTESDYIEVRYSAKDPAVSSQLEGKTFSRVFGTETSYLEILLLDRKIKGPCWLDIVNPTPASNPLSWCQIEVTCEKPINLRIAKDLENRPPLVVAAINIRRAINSKTLTNEIVMLSCVTNVAYHVDKQITSPFQKHFCVFSCPEGQAFPSNLYTVLKNYKATTVQKMDSERALLNYFITQWTKLDVDIVVGHDLQGYQINILSERLAHYNNNNFSKLGRLKRSTLVKQKLERTLFLGRLVCDIKTSAKELISLRSYDLDALCQSVLKIKEGQRIDLEAEDIIKMYSDSNDIIKLISLTMQDTANILKIMYNLNIIPLALQITNIAGNVMSRTLLGGRSERNEYLLLHAFTEKDYIVPDKVYTKKERDHEKKSSNRKKPTYAGGLVLDPKIGFYDRFILLMDFNSLYPSIIQEFNICFTTMPLTEIDEKNIILPDKSLPYGILPAEIRKLVESRREVKKLMNNQDISSDLKMQYHIRQMALKLTANSMYGCLGFSNSRFYAKNLAALITLKGREILTNTRDLVEKMQLEIIYGDTDSLMINTQITNYDQVFKIGKEIKQEVNKHYKQIELDIDGVFKYLLLLKKKKYAAVILSKDKNGELHTEVEYKGLDIVRRDWSKIASEAGKFILGQILSDQESEERSSIVIAYLNKLREDLEQNLVPISMLVITKQLTKNPNLYPDAKSLPHVQAALRYNRQNGGHFRAGDTVSYIICKDGTTNSHTQRAYLVEELRANSELKIDILYYLTQQIFPVVSRICSPIEELDVFIIAEVLGVDSSKVKVIKPVDASERFTENITEAEFKFKNCKPFSFKCPVCSCENVTQGVARDQKILEACQNEKCAGKPMEYFVFIKNHLTLTMNELMERYYLYEMSCENPMCDNNNTTRVPIKSEGRLPICTKCNSNSVMIKQYSEHDLYYQLAYYHHIFDRKNKRNVDPKLEGMYQELQNVVEKRMSYSGYSSINLEELFELFQGSNTGDSF